RAGVWPSWPISHSISGPPCSSRRLPPDQDLGGDALPSPAEPHFTSSEYRFHDMAAIGIFIPFMEKPRPAPVSGTERAAMEWTVQTAFCGVGWTRKWSRKENAADPRLAWVGG